MADFLYPKLAAGGIKKNKQTYIPYILTCSGMIMMYYIVSFLSKSSLVTNMRGGEIMQIMLLLGCWVMIFFSAIFLFYTNSFLIRRRKKEFGLYNILGMGKRNIARILVWETLIVFAVSLTAGNGLGILFSKLAELVFVNIFDIEVSYEFRIEPQAVTSSAAFYAAIFVVILIRALRQIRLSNPIELLRSENIGEKPPKSNWLLALLGTVLLAVAYYMAVTIENPISAVFAFFVAVLMVIAATYLLFIAGSVVICRMLQKNKNYYYKTNHFVSVSSMIYRMKRNGAGLASICILSTMVLVTLSSTICLYVGEEDILKERYPRDILITTYSVEEKEIERIRGFADAALEKYGVTPHNEIEYRYISISGAFNKGNVVLDPTSMDVASADVRTFTFVPIQDYNKLTGNDLTLSGNDVYIASSNGGYKFNSINIKELGEFNIVGEADGFVFTGDTAAVMAPDIYLFASDMEVINDIYEKQLDVYERRYASSLHDYIAFDIDCDDDTKLKIFEDIHHSISQAIDKMAAEGKEEEWLGYRVESLANDKAEFYALYGGLFFLGIILGSVFIFAAALIMYYKQISEGYEDKNRFTILQKVGMTQKEIRQSINSQVLTVFFLPLAAAAIHMAFAFPIVSRLLALFNLSNITLFAIVTLICFGMFAALYVLVYVFTSRSYYNIVSRGDDTPQT